MAHSRLNVAALAVIVGGCGGPSAPSAPAPPPVEAPRPVDAFASAPSSFARFPSKRFALTLPLPDGKTWRIDDHHQPWLVATHETSGSRVELEVVHEDAIMTRATCEARARARGAVIDAATVEDEVAQGPGPYDTRVWVATRSSAAGVEGHVYAFGGHLRTCFFFHFVTQGEPHDAEALPRRLAVARARILGGIAVSPARTGEDVELPRARPARDAPARPRVP